MYRMVSLLLRIALFVVLLPFVVLWLAAGAITWGADAILSSSRERGRPPFAIARRTSDSRFGSTVAVFIVLILAMGVFGADDGGQERSDEVVATASARDVAAQDDAAEAAEAEETEEAEKARAAQAEAEAQARRERVRAERLERRLRAAERRQARAAAARRRERREAARLAAVQRREERREQRALAAQAAAAEDCHSSYEGACLDPNASDYDCEGGSGDGPEYTGTVRVVGPDDYDLERDDDGIACDAS